MDTKTVRIILDTIDGGQGLTVGRADVGGVVLHGSSNISADGYKRKLADDLALECQTDKAVHAFHMSIAPRKTPGIDTQKDCFTAICDPSKDDVRAVAKELVEIERVYLDGIDGIETHWAHKAKVLGQSAQRS